MNKIKITAAILAVAVLFFIANRFGKNQASSAQETKTAAISVSVKAARDALALTKTVTYPASIAGDQEITVTAKSDGTVTALNATLGNRVAAGTLLATVDDTGSVIQQSQLSEEQAKEALDNAKKYYSDLKKDHAAGTATKAQLNAAKGQVEISEIQYDSAKVGYQSTFDDHRITSPIAGIITEKFVSVGDSITAGQPIASINKTANSKIQFYVDQEQRLALTAGQVVSVTDALGNTFSATVRNVSPVADPTTKRFLVEAYPKKSSDTSSLLGTVATVSFDMTTRPQTDGDFILPLSAITIGQNENYLFIAENGQAKKVSVTIAHVDGETAEISAPLSSDTLIITGGNKLLRNGDAITISQ